MKYIGVRSCTCHPNKDDYWSSSKHLPKDVKTTHKKRILKIHASRKEAIKHEIYLHYKYDVGKNSEFYNRAKQTSTKYDTSGIPNPHSEETRRKLSKALTGKKRTPEMNAAQSMRLKGVKQPPKTAFNRGKAIRENGSNKGIKNSSFRPWFISTDCITYIFYTTCKNDQSIIDGHYKKYYADIQKKFNKTGSILTNKYGKIVDMGFIPT
jgi:hypothetical protein